MKEWMNVVLNFSVRTQRLKQAKDEAEREAAQYRSHMEDEYQNSISEVKTEVYYRSKFKYAILFWNDNILLLG